jgi:hypothetical protein
LFILVCSYAQIFEFRAKEYHIRAPLLACFKRRAENSISPRWHESRACHAPPQIA